MENTKELVDKFKGRLEAEVRRQKKIEERWKVKLSSRGVSYWGSIQQDCCLGGMIENLKMNT